MTQSSQRVSRSLTESPGEAVNEAVKRSPGLVSRMLNITRLWWESIKRPAGSPFEAVTGLPTIESPLSQVAPG